MPKNQFRKAATTDARTIVSLHDAHYPSQPAKIRNIRRIVTTNTCFVIENSGEVIGYFLVEELTPDIANPSDLLIATNFRRKGLGSEFLSWCEQELNSDYSAILIATSTLFLGGNGETPRKFYERAGYHKVTDTGPSAIYVKDLRHD